MEKGKIKIDYDKKKNQIIIAADSKGLKYLSDIFLRISGKHSPAGHFHLMDKMGNLEKDSIDTLILYSEKL